MSNISLNNKNILLLVPAFFGYYNCIKSELESRGAKVYILKEDFVNSSYLYRFFWIKKQKMKYRYTNNYYKNLISRISVQIDYVLVIRGEALSREIMSVLKNKFKTAKYIIYQWDSVRNNPNSIVISDFFDKIYTFDFKDANQFGWIYRPLFYINNNYVSYKYKKYDFAFIGTLYYKRASLLRIMKEFCENNNLKLYSYLYSPKNVYILHKYIIRDKKYQDVAKKDVKFIPLSLENLSDIYNKSKILVDYTADDQTGLTMRTIESIGYKCKLITNNKEIIHTDIYNPDNVYVYDIDKFNIPDKFINTPYKEIYNVQYYYSLAGWVDIIFGEI